MPQTVFNKKRAAHRKRLSGRLFVPSKERRIGQQPSGRHDSMHARHVPRVSGILQAPHIAIRHDGHPPVDELVGHTNRVKRHGVSLRGLVSRSTVDCDQVRACL